MNSSKHSLEIYHRIKMLVIYPKINWGNTANGVTSSFHFTTLLVYSKSIKGVFILSGVREG